MKAPGWISIGSGIIANPFTESRQEATNTARYSNPDRQQLLSLAEMAEAYCYLLSPAISTKVAVEKLRSIRKALKETTHEKS